VTNSVYVPDNSSKGTSVARLTFDPVSETLRPSGAISVGAFGSRPTSTAMGPDGSLYVGFTRGNNVVRVADPANVPSVSLVGTTAAGGAAGLAVANASDGSLNAALYIAEGGGVSEIDNPATCAGACAAFLTNIVPQNVVNGKVIAWETTAITAPDPNTLYVASGLRTTSAPRPPSCRTRSARARWSTTRRPTPLRTASCSLGPL
jgi:hypothetical protein